jgi:hypothetical protein
MPNENDSDGPTPNPQGQSSQQSPVTPTTPLQGALPNDGKGKPDQETAETKELAREFRMAEKWVIGTNIVLVIIGIGALCIYNGQLRVMHGQLNEVIKQYPEIKKSADAAKKSADVARDSLISVQRAFVVITNAEVNAIQVGSERKFTVTFTWQNAGTTPAIGMISHISFEQPNHALPKTFSFPDLWGAKEAHTYIRGPMAPHGVRQDSVGMLSRTAIIALADKPIYFWGWARYRDIFKDTPEHLTNFCSELTGFYGDPMSVGPEMVKPLISMCPYHNCTDDDCKEEK